MKWKMRKAMVIILLLTYFTVSNLIPSSGAEGTEYNAVYRSTAGITIDGNVTSTEWGSITPYNLTFQYDVTANSTIKAELYLLHDGEALYIGLNMTIGDNQSDDEDAFNIYIDESHDEELRGLVGNPKEAGLKVFRNGTYVDLCYDNVSHWIADESESLTNGPSSGAANGAGQWEFKFVSSYDSLLRKSYDTSDFDEDLPSIVLENALTFGINIEYYDADIDLTDSCTTTVNGTERLNASAWDDVVCGTVPTPPPNLDSLWTYVIVAMIVPLGVFLYVLLWIKRKKIE